MESGRIEFRAGTDEYGAKAPAGFPYRFAVLTWMDRDGDGADPWSLLRVCIPAIARKIGADIVTAEYWKREKRSFRKPVDTKVNERSWEELMKKSDEELHENEDFPNMLRFESRQRVVLVVESEMWSLVGGPMPYHDSVTLSFFSSEDLSGGLEKIFREAALGRNFEIANSLHQ